MFNIDRISGIKMETMFGEINVMGLCSIILFYLLILGVGMWAARKKSDVEGVSEEVGNSSQPSSLCSNNS